MITAKVLAVLDKLRNGELADRWYKEKKALFPEAKNMTNAEFGKFFIDKFMKGQKQNFILDFYETPDDRLKKIFTVSPQKLAPGGAMPHIIVGYVKNGKFHVKGKGVIPQDKWYYLVDDIIDAALKNAGKTK